MEEDEEAVLGTCRGLVEPDAQVEETIVGTVVAAETDDGMIASTY